jgi:Ni/Fe-hydrogenase subunit HybB-like protein
VIVYVKDLLVFMERHALHLQCDVYDWWNEQRERELLDAAFDWINCDLYSPEWTGKILVMFWRRLPRITRVLMLKKLRETPKFIWMVQSKRSVWTEEEREIICSQINNYNLSRESILGSEQSHD